MTTAAHILVIDDDGDIRELIVAAAEGMRIRCTAVTNAAELPRLLTPDVSLILLDLMMPQMDGIEVLRMLGQLGSTAGIVLMSGISKRVMETAEKLARSLDLSIAGHLSKPFRLAELENLLRGHTIQAPAAAAIPGPRFEIADEDLRNAIRNREFVLYYQPQIDIASGEVEGLEALARWQHPRLGLLAPDCFVSRLESMGEIDTFGWLMADLGLEEARRFASNGRPAPRIALNVSAQSLRDLRFPDTFVSLAGKHSIPAESIMVEITESSVLQDPSSALDVLTRLRMKNIQLSIDDFGTGYAMMQQLVNIPANELKIDKVFVLNMHTNSSDRVMVEKTIEIGHELGMTVTAEGVENESQLHFLRQRGCDRAQGFLFSRPLPLASINQWINDRHARGVHA
jgi:EAL domain-containing protein (putative c-di-GMP-specific phosphodiesterase class I)/ActR/RegA family two-component response regulator